MASTQQFNLRWNNHTNNILQVFLEQLSNENLVDVTLSCQGQFLKAHKMVLSACSPYFQELFQQHQVQHPVIIMNGMKFVDVKLVIEFMYKGEIKVLENELADLLAVAETLQIKGLCNVRNKYEKGDIQCADSENAASGTAQEYPNTNSSQGRRKKRKLSGGIERVGHLESIDGSDDNSSLLNNGIPIQNTLPLVQVSMNEYPDDDELPSTIKVEPPDIRDIDENEHTGWESPKLPESSEINKITQTLPITENNEIKGNENRIENKDLGKINPQELVKINPQELIKINPQELVKINPQELIKINPQELIKINPQDIIAAGPSQEILKDHLCHASTSAVHPSLNIINKKRTTTPYRIPRPPNAFMIFANEWRRKLAFQHPTESNKEISVRLGIMWKNLSSDTKEGYYAASRVADEEHKKKYPGYYYSPKEARIRKNMKADLALARKNAKPMDAIHLVKVFMSDHSNEVPIHMYMDDPKQPTKIPISLENKEEKPVEKEQSTKPNILSHNKSSNLEKN